MADHSAGQQTDRKEPGGYVEVWGDTVSLPHLGVGLAVTIVLTMGGYLLAPGGPPQPLIAGLIGSAVGFVICAVAIRPKREVRMHTAADDAEGAR